MADRIRIFQDVQPVERQSPSLLPPPPLSKQELVSLPAVDRKEPFSTAPGVSSKPDTHDPDEHLSDHGPQPLKPSFKSNSLPEKPGLPPRKLLSTRPTNSKVPSPRPSLQHNQVQSPEQALSRRGSNKHNTGGNNRDATQTSPNLAHARSRLKSIGDSMGKRDMEPRSRAYTMAELNHLLDNAIEGNDDDDVFSDQPTGEGASGNHQRRRPHTTLASHKPSLDPKPDLRSSIDTIRPRSSEESERVVYDDDRDTLYWPHLSVESARKNMTVTRSSNRPRQLSAPKMGSLGGEKCDQQGKSLAANELSPIRQKAAMFERLGTQTSSHDPSCRDSLHLYPNSHLPKTKPRSITRMHRIKFGDIIEERSGTPLIPLTLPSLIHPKEDESKDLGLEELRDSDGEAIQDDSGLNDGSSRKLRKTSVSWPFKWNIFNKSPAPPKVTEAEERIKHDPGDISVEPGVVKSRVRELAQAAKEREDSENKKWALEKDRMRRRHSRIPTVMMKKSESPASEVALESVKPSHIRTFQVPLLEGSDSRLQVPDLDCGGQRTPLHKAMTEKQVLPTMDTSETSDTPRAFEPQTPKRRRSTKREHGSFAEDHDTRNVVAQQFNLSPVIGRSMSRNRGAVRVEVEVRGSPEREARERGEKIVIVRANVDNLEGV